MAIEQGFNQPPLPNVADVILKVKQMQELSPAEELVYLIHIEEIPEARAVEIIQHKYHNSEE